MNHRSWSILFPIHGALSWTETTALLSSNTELRADLADTEEQRQRSERAAGSREDGLGVEPLKR